MKKLLLADDSSTIQKVVQLCFADEPFELQIAADGPRAAELLGTWRPDVMLVDVLLPGIDGYELCQRAKRENAIPVVLLVGTFEPFDFGRAEQAGYDSYLTKPFDTVHLVQVVKGLSEESVRTPKPGGPAGPAEQAEETRSHERQSFLLEFEAPSLPARAELLEIEDLSLPVWGRQIVPQIVPPLPPIPVQRVSPPSGSADSTWDFEEKVASVVDRLLPRWVDAIRAELMEELKRLH